MAQYINPKGKTKLEWLKEYGEEIVWCTRKASIPEGFNVVCHVDNFSFKTAIIIDSQKDLDELNNGIDCRPKRWFYVLIEDVRKVK